VLLVCLSTFLWGKKKMVDDPALVTVIMELLVEKITLNFEQLA
jgi:hypothetical protein